MEGRASAGDALKGAETDVWKQTIRLPAFLFLLILMKVPKARLLIF